MANYSMTITNSIRCFGVKPSVKWGSANGYPYTMAWGVSPWGQDSQLATLFQKVVDNSQSLTWAHTKAMDYVLTSPISNSISPLFSMTSEALSDESGWNHVFVSDTIAGSERDFASWSADSANDATFTCSPAGATSWSTL